jgi:hypothetical protein
MVGMVPPASSSQNPVSCKLLEAHHGVSAHGGSEGSCGRYAGKRSRPVEVLGLPTQHSATQPSLEPSSTSQPGVWDIVCKSLAITRCHSTSRISSDQHLCVHALSLKSVRGLQRPELDVRVHRGAALGGAAKPQPFAAFAGLTWKHSSRVTCKTLFGSG